MDTANTAKKKPAKKKAAKAEPIVPLMALNMDQAGLALGCSTPVVYLLVNDGLLKSFTVGRKRYVSPRAIQECVDKLEAQGTALPIDSGFNNGNSPKSAAESVAS